MKIELSELVALKKGKKLEEISCYIDNSVRYIQIEDLRNDSNLKYTIDKNAVLVDENDILIAWDGANAGTIGFGLNGAIGSTITAIKIKKEYHHLVSPRFLGLFLKGKSKFLRDTASGATIPHIQKSVLLKLEIFLPSLETQQKIANTLEFANELIETREEQLTEMDRLIQSVFYEMFGDPVINELNWNLETLSKLGTLGRGKSKHRPRNAPELLGGKYPLIQTGDVANSGIFIKKFKNTYSELGLQQSKMWSKGTLCITIAANIAKTGILTFDSCFPDSVVGLETNGKTNVIFMHVWFSFFQKILEANAPESAQKNINLKILSNLEVICPPINFQNKFSYIVEEIEVQKLVMEESLKEMENNYNVLMQKAFRGELFPE